MNTKDYLDSLNNKINFETGFLNRLRVEARAEGVPVMLRETSQLLTTLISMKKPKNILEIGTAVGYSGSIMLKYSDKKSRLTTIDLNESHLERAKKNFKSQNFYERVRIFTGDATEIIPVMSGKFDFIFVDGPKSRYDEFFPYLKKMLIPGGVLVCDNVLFRDMVSGKEKTPHRMNTIVSNMRQFLDDLSKDKDFITDILDIGDGVSISVKLK